MAGHEVNTEAEEALVAAFDAWRPFDEGAPPVVAAVFAADLRRDPPPGPPEPPRLERQIAVLGPAQNEEKGPTSMDWSD